MALLLGRIDHQMDSKNRIRIPAKYKSAFPQGEKLFFYRLNEKRIAVMPESVVQARLSSFAGIDPGDEEVSDCLTALTSSIEEVTEDGQGRTPLPKWVRDIAGLKKDVVTVGKINYIELWDKERFERDIAPKTTQQINAGMYKKPNAEQGK